MSSNEKIVVFGPALPMNLAPMWVAHDKGFFKEEGLDVDLRPVQGIPDSQHPRHQWRKDGAIIFQSPGGSPPFRSVLENRDHIDGEVNVVSIANRTAHVFVAKPYVKDIPDLKGRKIAGDLKGGSSMDAKVVLRHYGLDPEKDLTWIDSRGKPPNTERFRLALFDKGEVDAVCCDPPHWNIAVQMGGHALTSCRDLFAIPEAGFSTSPAVIAENHFVYKSLSNWSFNTAVGCSHACRFCYVPSAATTRHAPRGATKALTALPRPPAASSVNNRIASVKIGWPSSSVMFWSSASSTLMKPKPRHEK